MRFSRKVARLKVAEGCRPLRHVDAIPYRRALFPGDLPTYSYWGSAPTLVPARGRAARASPACDACPPEWMLRPALGFPAGAGGGQYGGPGEQARKCRGMEQMSSPGPMEPQAHIASIGSRVELGRLQEGASRAEYSGC